MKRKTFFVLLGCLSLIVFLTSISLAAAKHKTGPPSHAKKVKFEVLNPRGEIDPPPTLGISPRLDTLEGKTIGLYWNAKPTGVFFFDHVEELLKERYNNNITIVRYGGAFNCGEARAKEIAQEVDAVIYGHGD
jgi:hypothetical protein